MIPKIIHYCWFGGGKLPDQEQAYIEGWKKKCPDFEIMEWNETNYDIHKCRYMEEAASVGKWSFVSDYARLDVLYQYGGIYLDTDVEVLKDLAPLCKHEGFIGFESRERVNDGQGFGAEKGNALIKEMMGEYDQLSFFSEDGSYNQIESPQYRTKVLKAHGLIMNEQEQEIEGVHIYPTDYFCPKNFTTGKIKVTDHTYCIHHFKGSWHTVKERKIIAFTQKICRVLGEKNGNAFCKWMFEFKDDVKEKFFHKSSGKRIK